MLQRCGMIAATQLEASMDAPQSVSPLELGRHLTHVRERAGIKQAELARRGPLRAADLVEVLARLPSA